MDLAVVKAMVMVRLEESVCVPTSALTAAVEAVEACPVAA